MNIGQFLDQSTESASEFAERIGVAPSTMYRWLDEEEARGFVRHLTGEQLVKLIEGSRGLIQGDDVLKPKRVRPKAPRRTSATAAATRPTTSTQRRGI